MKKYNYLKVIQGYYGAWEDLAEYDTKSSREMRALRGDFKDFLVADSAPKRIVSRRVTRGGKNVSVA